MFNSMKQKFYSVVHESIDLDTVRKKISKVQEHVVKKHRDVPLPEINVDAGSELLTKYQKEWKEMHESAEKNAELADHVDKHMLHIHASIKSQLDSLVQMNTTLSTLPQVTSVVEDCISQIKELAVLFEIVENELIDLEDLVEANDFQKRQLEHTFQLTMYKEKKLAAFEKSRVSMAMQQAGVAKAAEQQQREELKQRQQAAHNAFLNDLVLYKTQGTLPKKPEESIEIDKTTTLEEIQLDSDDTELDEFLNK